MRRKVNEDCIQNVNIGISLLKLCIYKRVCVFICENTRMPRRIFLPYFTSARHCVFIVTFFLQFKYPNPTLKFSFPFPHSVIPVPRKPIPISQLKRRQVPVPILPLPHPLQQQFFTRDPNVIFRNYCIAVARKKLHV